MKEGGERLTHLAVNSGIPLRQDPVEESENVMRSPSGLVMLHGDFGPKTEIEGEVGEEDLEKAFWVRTKQNGIFQVWAPRYTMFSRGNVKEKARILKFHEPDANQASMERTRVNSRQLRKAVAVDLYAGIGYFTFSYVQMGIGKVLCWEINPWSVEGLRRGMEKNGWSCRIVKGKELEKPLWELLDDDVRVVVLEESNERAAGRIEELRRREEGMTKRVLEDIIHVNCGFLPSSEPSWETAWQVASKSEDSWLHMHENVMEQDVEKRRGEIGKHVGKWASDESSSSVVDVEHVELVKTFAPGVWHCVFDVHIGRVPIENQ